MDKCSLTLVLTTKTNSYLMHIYYDLNIDLNVPIDTISGMDKSMKILIFRYTVAFCLLFMRK